MKKIRKVFAVIFVIVFVIACAVPVLAANEDGNSQGGNSQGGNGQGDQGNGGGTPGTGSSTGSLIISKKFTGDVSAAPEGWDAMFTVSGPSGYEEDFYYSDFTNGSLLISDLTPGSYSVTETNGDIDGYDWDVSYSSQNGMVSVAAGSNNYGGIGDGQGQGGPDPHDNDAQGDSDQPAGGGSAPAKITVTNYYELIPGEEIPVGSLTVNKAFNIDEIPGDWSATINVKGVDNEYEDTKQINSGTRVATFYDLEPGDYIVEEIGGGISSYDNWEVSYSDEGGVGLVTVAADGEATLTVTNRYWNDEIIPDTFSLLVQKQYSGHALPENFYIEVTSDALEAAIRLEVGDDYMVSNENGLVEWLIEGLDEGEYTAREYNYSVAGYSVSGTTQATTANFPIVDVDTELVYNANGILTLVNNYSANTRITTTTTLRDPDPTPEPDPDPDPDPIVEELEVIDEEPPRAEFVPEEEVMAEETVEILDEPTPMSEMPQTGINDSLTTWIFALCLSLLGAGTLSAVVKKASKKED